MDNADFSILLSLFLGHVSIYDDKCAALVLLNPYDMIPFDLV